MIEGPGRVPQFEKFFETSHNLNAKHLATMFDIPYYFCENQNGLDEILKTFYQPQNGRPAILENKNKWKIDAEIYKGYFEHLRSKRNSTLKP